jgi:type II secretory pathway pseudopilin PulG
MGMTRQRRGAPSETRRGRAARRRGFTIVSMIVAIVLLTVGILALGNANTGTIKGQVLAQNRTNALAIGRAYLEEVRARDPWTLASESAVQVGPDGVEVSGGPYTRRLEVSEERQNLLLVELFVDFPRSTQPVRLSTYQYRGSGLSSAP